MWKDNWQEECIKRLDVGDKSIILDILLFCGEREKKNMSAFAYLQKDYDKIQQKKKLETDLVKNLNKPNSNKKRKREDHVDDTTENEADDEMVKMVKRLKKTKKRDLAARKKSNMKKDRETLQTKKKMLLEQKKRLTAMKTKLFKSKKKQNALRDEDEKEYDPSSSSSSTEEEEEEEQGDEMENIADYIGYLEDGINQANANIKAQEKMFKTLFNINVDEERENRSEELLQADEEAQRKRNAAAERAFNTLKRVSELEDELKQHDQFKAVMKSMLGDRGVSTEKTKDKKEAAKKTKSKPSKASKSEELEEENLDTLLADALAKLEKKKNRKRKKQNN